MDEVTRPSSGWIAAPERPENELAVIPRAQWRLLAEVARWRTRRRILRVVVRWALFTAAVVGTVLLAVIGFRP